ncbi:hypothetical protein PoB_004153500 [Plakobranchus ocellatus]|uniref:Uncharacterized protein n=1 Tax=Plakobranchus ocellatus TaxID=259542 RepID=A0AAV4B7F6_9GAST|nr:hypothetical protein PoB_004153500 [Plakobranchus ocellatus]
MFHWTMVPITTDYLLLGRPPFVGRSSAFLLLATETPSQAASVQGVFALARVTLDLYSQQRVGTSTDSTWEEKEVEDNRRRGRRDYSAGKEVGIEDKSQVEKEMSPCPEREAVHRQQPALVASYDPRQPRWSLFFPGPHTGGNLIPKKSFFELMKLTNTVPSMT